MLDKNKYKVGDIVGFQYGENEWMFTHIVKDYRNELTTATNTIMASNDLEIFGNINNRQWSEQLKHIHNSIKNTNGPVAVTMDYLSQVKEFRTMVECKSLESVALSLGGHCPIMNPTLDHQKIQQWCDENHIRWKYEESEMKHYFKKAQ